MNNVKKEKIEIDMHPTECAAMDAFIEGDSEKGNLLQDSFVKYLKEEIGLGKDHCPCTANCNLHANCLICVQVHRAHGNHLPVCLQPMVNKRIEAFLELTEHTIE